MKTVLITGATDGVGRRVAERLAAPDIHLLIHGRDQQRAESLLAHIRSKGGSGEICLADFSALSEVRHLADYIRREHRTLELLINNAGIGVGKRGSARAVSADGFELRFAVNYLAGFVLTHRLLPLLMAGNSARIINVTSVGQQAIDFDDVMLARHYSGERAYCQSKLAQIMFTFDLAEELAGSTVTVNCLHPATYMDTTMVRLDGMPPLSTIDKGADAILNLALAPEFSKQSGLYLDGHRQTQAHTQAYDSVSRKRLRDLSRRVAEGDEISTASTKTER